MKTPDTDFQHGDLVVLKDQDSWPEFNSSVGIVIGTHRVHTSYTIRVYFANIECSVFSNDPDFTHGWWESYALSKILAAGV